jgi:ring-1,2-phenylacetyl-CoA epoxidase subunit PaaB
MDTQLDLWEVFIANKAGSHVHAGSVHASDRQMALQNARDIYTRRQEGSSIWVVPSRYVTASNPEEADMFFDPANDKIYRHPTFYVMPEGAKQI